MIYHVIKDHREIPYNLNKNKYAIVHAGYNAFLKIGDALHMFGTRHRFPVSRRSMSLSHTRHCVDHLHN